MSIRDTTFFSVFIVTVCNTKTHKDAEIYQGCIGQGHHSKSGRYHGKTMFQKNY